MRIVVSGSHASGKSTLVSDLAATRPGWLVLPDPYELVDVLDPASAESFHAQLLVAADRLLALRPGARAIAERGPLDLLAYLLALDALGRTALSREVLEELRDVTAAAMAHVDLLVVLPIAGLHGVRVPAEEDPDLRSAMDEQLLDLCADEDLVGAVGRLVEVGGSHGERLAALVGLLPPAG